MGWRYNPRSKYGAQKVNIDGERFDSKREARRYQELRLLERAGEIRDLKRQVKFVLIQAQREPDTIGPRGAVKRGKIIEREAAYIADFTYYEGEQYVVEDAKGMKTDVYKLKKKLMLERYGIQIRET